MRSNDGQFELTVLGCSGGPISGKTCSYIIKPCNVSYKDILTHQDLHDNLLAVDAGSGLTALAELVAQGPKLKGNYLLQLYNSRASGYSGRNYYQDETISITDPFATIPRSLTPLQTAWQLININSGYLVTHSHFDHVAGLVLNSPCFETPRRVFGLNPTITGLRDSIFNNSAWPDLVTAGMVQLNMIEPFKLYTDINTVYDVTAFPVAHGSTSSDSLYMSTAFLLTQKSSHTSLMLFGDLESDQSSGATYNEQIWKAIAPLIVNGTLTTLLMECSSQDKPPPLYGHMTPTSIIEEMLILQKYCLALTAGSSPLKGINIIITHVKETRHDVNPRTAIYDELVELNARWDLGIHFSIALPGLSYAV